ncbi:DUF4188 domain-containing protein [Motilibacter aurantiacus]|uniref:DUF4188 domain-containing protein n=1 Tax=Motilibacter aurantiacus TaxID=2714955 RepID=UPI0014086D6C|nr:DUF4188 domain-containing protein [Motilibacter aurantiacus]NHC44477.1 DUF4188 domain-containing protein [Motilibacter aurantiacus]
MSATVVPGRMTAATDDDVVVFLIGMRVNRLRAVRSWLPAALAMPRMLRELWCRPELGMLDARTYYSGRVILVVQYWRSFEHLDAYARAADREHLPAWRAFNKQARSAGDAAGIFHETYLVPGGSRESIYVGMPAYGLGRALGVGPVARRGERAAHRLDARTPDVPVVDAAGELVPQPDGAHR